jgi:uncharacterized alpha-E superfamily protein
VAEFLFATPDNPGSVVSSARHLRENIRSVRDRVPVELWEESNRLYLDLVEPGATDLLHDAPFVLFTSVRRSCQTIAEVVAEAMPRDEGYAFFDCGRLVERATVTCRIIRFGLYSEHRDFDDSVVLRMVSSLQAYRRMVGYDDRPIDLAAFLLGVEQVPRTVISCLRAIEDRLGSLEAVGSGVRPARRVFGRVRSLLEFGDIEASLTEDPVSYLLQVEAGVINLGDVIAAFSFNPAHIQALHAQFVRPGIADA